MSIPTAAQERLREIQAWAIGFDDLSLRERLLTSAAILGVTFAIWLYVIDRTLTSARAGVSRTIEMTQAETALATQNSADLLRLAAKDPDQAITKELAIVRADLITIEARLETSLAQFISPNAMTLVLRDVMSDHKNLSLTLLNRLPARELLPAESSSNLYLHPMRLELEGAYLDVLHYIQSLEAGDWQFNWRSFEYIAKEYPNGVATIEIETLSRDKHWLGL